ncbi:MAG: NAAT family transporter [Gammaproteobacteria bacterium]|nr:NAAT family transporter [Gammaproteobacteria bacterium]
MNANPFTVTGLTATTAVLAAVLLGGIVAADPGRYLGAMELFDSAAFWALAAPLFAIMNPLVAVPFFSDLTEGQTDVQRNRLAMNATIAVGVTLATAALLGDEVLDLFAISIGSFRIAGGIVVLCMGLGLVRATAGREDRSNSADSSASQAICPIAIPLLAGPGAIAAVIVHCDAASRTGDYVTLAVVLLVMTAIVFATLRMAVPVARYLGKTGMTVASRLLGMVVVAVAIDMATIGIGLRFPNLLG